MSVPIAIGALSFLASQAAKPSDLPLVADRWYAMLIPFLCTYALICSIKKLVHWQ